MLTECLQPTSSYLWYYSFGIIPIKYIDKIDKHENINGRFRFELLCKENMFNHLTQLILY